VSARAAKRAFDVAASGAGLLLSLPVIGLAAIAIRVWMGPPVLFRQRRAGLHGATFQIIKLRTMTDERDAAGKLLPDQQRLRGLGKLIRRLSIDELPQLWNILKGDMSLVGPRPLLTEYLERYDPRQRRRHEVRPGLTGLAQIQGRNALEWEQRFRMDVWYVDHWTFELDLRILLTTVWHVLTGRGDSAPASEFLGTPARTPGQ
jgi:sugar transferase EpsL